MYAPSREKLYIRPAAEAEDALRVEFFISLLSLPMQCFGELARLCFEMLPCPAPPQK